jgi:hypothetical protein
VKYAFNPPKIRFRPTWPETFFLSEMFFSLVAGCRGSRAIAAVFMAAAQPLHHIPEQRQFHGAADAAHELNCLTPSTSRCIAYAKGFPLR